MWDSNGQQIRFELCYDGKYLWAAGTVRGKNPVLLVLDPATGKVIEVTGKHGFPEMTPKQVETTKSFPMRG